ncbi:MAG: hypothetical protein M3O70_13880 [Actinomycetota bacterium]|nr:hypothetical protein [Actinomycetota bacterium]
MEFYGMLRAALEPGGRAAILAGSPYFAPEAFWYGRQLAGAGPRTTP